MNDYDTMGLDSNVLKNIKDAQAKRPQELNDLIQKQGDLMERKNTLILDYGYERDSETIKSITEELRRVSEEINKF